MEKRKFKVGDFIFHKNYGVGKITKIEKRELLGEAKQYYRVRGNNSNFWVPLGDIDPERVRPVAKKWKIKKARTVLRKPPRKLASDFRTRTSNHKALLSKGSIIDLAQLYRDLRGRRLRRSRLTPTEEQILERIHTMIVKEWSVVMGVTEEKATATIDRHVDVSLQNVEAGAA